MSEATFGADPRSVGEARAFVRHELASRGLSEAQHDASLVVSALATRAVLAHEPFRVTLSVTGGRVRLEVSDVDRGSHRLFVLASVASDWGVGTGDAGPVIWAETVADPRAS